MTDVVSFNHDLVKHVATILIFENPVPATRPRIWQKNGITGSYYPKRYKNWRKAMDDIIPEGDLALEGRLFVEVESVVQRPKTTKLDEPKPDVDNFGKAPLDAITKAGGYWDDDYQVSVLVTSKRWTVDEETPHTRMEIYVPRTEA